MNLHFIDAGKFRSLLSLQKNKPVPDDSGGYLSNWIECATLWGQIQPLAAGGEGFAQQSVPHVTHRIIIRHRTDLSIASRLVRGERLFSITGFFDPDESRRYLICQVKEEM